MALALREEEDPPGLRWREEFIDASDGARGKTVGRHAAMIV